MAASLLATAVILGPFTLIGPVLALAGGVAGAWVSHRALVGTLAVLAALAALAVIP